MARAGLNNALALFGMISFSLSAVMSTPQVVKGGREVDMQQSAIRAELWHGPLCYEKSEIEAEQTFPMSEEGRAAMLAWLEENI